ncbi:hypothetical protein DFH09DRAFT_1161295 [Mycena vulgaris]|nr:hypothetical protein DFH09DRAFT_1161295 [Mycena vulgaris]
MHPALTLSSLNLLPPIIGKIARGAANGSLDDLITLQSVVLDASAPKSHLDSFLPAFYINLERAVTPTAGQLETLSRAAKTTVLVAWVSFESIHQLDFVPVDAFHTLWPPLWKWAQFFHARCDQLGWMSPEGGPSGAVICTNFVRFVRSFHSSEQLVELMLSTPGFRHLVTRSWLHRIRNDDPDLAVGYPDLKHLILTRGHRTTADQFQDIINGAGGTYADLALLVVGYIDGILPGRNNNVQDEVFQLLPPVVDFINKIDEAMEGNASTNDSPLGTFGVALIQHRFVRALTTMTYALSHITSTPGATLLLSQSLTYLLRIFKDPHGHRSVSEALDAGLLYTVASCSIVGVMHPESSSILRDILPASIAYYSTVAAMDNAFAEAQGLVHTDFFARSKLVEDWRWFTGLIRERLPILDSFRGRDSPLQRACDDVQCGKITEKVTLGRCSACQSFYYCSRECQKNDWRAGAHREACALGNSYHLGQRPGNALGVRDRLFLRALITHDYKASKWTVVCPQKLAFMAAHPNELYFTLFDYRRGRVEITVESIADAPGELAASAEWLNDVVRAAKSHGELDLDVVALSEATETRYFVVPLRTNNSGTHGTLAQLARLGVRRKDIPEVVEGVRLSNDALSPNALEIH